MAREVIRRHGSLEIDENPAFQNVTWVVERVAWAVLGLLLLAALAGAFGHGPISRTEQSSADGALTVEYPRVARLESPDEMRLRLRPSGPKSVVELDGDFADAFLVENVKPEPSRQRSRGETILLEFESEPGREQTIRVDVRPRRPALPARGRLHLDGGPPVELSTYVLP